MTARGERNNNPGNIRKSKDKWQGLSASQPDKEFFTFKDPIYGIRALARILINYQDDYNIRTVKTIISRWAPSVENNTDAYVNAVCKSTGFGSKELLNVHNFEHLEPLVKAIIKHELGYQPYTDTQITKALVLAGVEPDKQPDLHKTRTATGAKVAVAATGASVVADAIDKAEPVIPLVKTLAEYAPFALSVLILAGIGYIIYARWDDRRKGLR